MSRHDKVYRVNRDGSGEMVNAEERAKENDLGVVIDHIVGMAMDLLTVFQAIPDRSDDMFNASVRQAYLNAGNALDYAFRVTDEIRGNANAFRLRRELAEEMKHLGLSGDPIIPGTPQPHVTMTEEQA